MLTTLNDLDEVVIDAKGKPYYQLTFNDNYPMTSDEVAWELYNSKNNGSVRINNIIEGPDINVLPNGSFEDAGKISNDLVILKGRPVKSIHGNTGDFSMWFPNEKYYAEGGEVDDPRKQIINRSVAVASNYGDAKDFTLDPFNYAIRKISKTLFGRGGISNCTLSATGWIDPNNQYMSAKNLFNNPESGYVEVDKEYALPGDLLIAKNPEKDSYHTMLIEGFNGDDPLLRYSRGGHNTKKNLVTGRSLEEYHRLDNEQGGNHTEDHYFRYNIPNEYWLPEIVVTLKK